MKHKTTILIMIFLSMLSCGRTRMLKDAKKTYDTIADIDSLEIKTEDVDKLIQQELYDELSRIYLIRKVALDQVINEKVLLLEAGKRNVSLRELKDQVYGHKINTKNLEKFVLAKNYARQIDELRETLVFHDIKSAKGQEILTARYKDYLLNHFIDSLKCLHHICIKLKPPKSPKITIDNLIVHYKGNLNAKVTFLVISDFDCHMCRESNPFFEKLFSEYKGKVRFGFTHYSSYVSNSAIASECASNQDKFWEMHDSIFIAKLIPDSVALFRIAKNLNLNMNTFDNDFKNKALSDKIHDNLLKLESAGIYGTPTIMINNQLVFNSTSLNEIEKMLKEEIKKVE